MTGPFFDITLSNTRRAHHLKLHAVPPATLARPLTIEAHLSSRNTDDIKTWNGSVDASVAGVSLPRLSTWLALPYPTRQDWGEMKVEFQVARGEFASVTAALDLREIETTLGDDLPALQLAQLRGQAMWARGPDGQRVAFENLRLARPGGTLGAPFNAGLAWNAESRELTARASAWAIGRRYCRVCRLTRPCESGCRHCSHKGVSTICVSAGAERSPESATSALQPTSAVWG